MDDQTRTRLDNALQLLSLNGYSVFSLIDDILTRSNRANQSIDLLRDGLERDAADICARLLNHDPTSDVVSVWALGAVQTKLRSGNRDERLDDSGRDRAPDSDDSGWERDSDSDADEMAGPTLCAWLWKDTTFSPGYSYRTAQSTNHRHKATIDILPDNVFLTIFHFRLQDSDPTKPLECTRKWQRLAHVCQRWRKIVFGLPNGQRRLDLQLTCSYKTHVRKNLVFWPDTFPLTVDYPGSQYSIYGASLFPNDEDNIIFALQHARRVHRIKVLATGSLLRKIPTLLQKSFPALTHLDLEWDLYKFPESDSLLPAIPGRFLGGSAPCLQHFRLNWIAFPELPTFLLSARNLVTLKLEEIPPHSYISPEAMVGSLAVLTKLTTLSVSFCKETYPLDQRRDPPVHAILPVLTDFHYRGHGEYLENFLAQIDTPQINSFRVEYFMQPTQVSRLSQFINRTKNLKLNQFTCAEVTFKEDAIFELGRPHGERCQVHLSLKILGRESLYMQVPCLAPCLANVLGQLAATFSNVDRLTASGDKVRSREMDSTKWLPFFRLFPAVKALDLSGGVASHISSALVDAAKLVNEVFPVLQSIGLDEK